MSTWEDFEIQCVNHLNEKFSDYARFTHQGGTDSTTADILVKTQKSKSFYVEAKHSPAQCGQFVLLPNLATRTFQYSSLNATDINQYSETIINYMNKDFDSFRNAGTAGKEIDIKNASDIFTGWIITTYKSKGVEFFITNGFFIFPIKDFAKYFDVTAKYRIKRSGSGDVGKSRFNTVMKYICEKGYNIANLRVSGNKMFLTSSEQLHNKRFILDGTEYMFSLRGNEFEIRKLSDTYNANVIFSVKLKDKPPHSENTEFIEYLR